MTTNPKELEARARELRELAAAIGGAGLARRKKSDEVRWASKLAEIADALSQPAEPSDAAVETVARVLACENSSVSADYDEGLLWACLDDRARNHWIRLARAAIAAMRGEGK